MSTHSEPDAPAEQNQRQPIPQPSPQHEDGIEVFEVASQCESGDGDESEEHNFLTIQYDEDAWDDTALIQAYERAAKSYSSNPKIPKHNASEKEGASTTAPAAGRKSSRKQAANPRVMVSASEHSRKRKAAVQIPQAPTPHVRLSKRSKQNIHREEAPYLPSKTASIPEDGDVIPAHEHEKMLIPPPPPPVLQGQPLSEDLEKLLKSWYEAGYRAGLYVGKQSR